MATCSPERPAPSLLPYLLLCAVAAACINLGTLHRYHNGDSLLPVLVSLYRWTPFFWLQDRIGMLVPLLAVPIHHPFYNLLFQGFLYVFSGLAALYLLPRYMLRDATYPLVGTVAATAFLVLVPRGYQFDFFLTTFYGVWLALGLGGLVLLEPRPDGTIPWPRCLAALVLFMLTHWVFVAAFFILVPLVVMRALLCPGPGEPFAAPDRSWRGWAAVAVRRVCNRETRTTLFLLGAGFAFGMALMKNSWHFFPLGEPTSSKSVPVEQWPWAWGELARTTWTNLAPQWWPGFLIAAAAVGLAMLTVPRVRQQAGLPLRAALALAVAGMAYALAMGTRDWVRRNDYCDRYWKPAVFLVQAAFLLPALAPWCRALGDRIGRRLGLLTAPALLAGALMVYGLPSLRDARAAVDWHSNPREGDSILDATPQTRDVLAADCTHVTGDYWRVWPLVFHTNLVLYERGEQRVLWGLCFRGQVTQPLWERTPRERMRIGIVLGDPVGEGYLKEFKLSPMEEVARFETIRVLRPRGGARRRPHLTAPFARRGRQAETAVAPDR